MPQVVRLTVTPEAVLALGINDRGQVVGYTRTPHAPNGTHAVVWDNGRITDLNTPLPPGSGWTLEAASAINDAVEITIAINDAVEITIDQLDCTV